MFSKTKLKRLFLDVLDTNDEILINPNMLDTERLKRNIEAKKRQSRYQDEDEVDEYGQVQSLMLMK